MFQNRGLNQISILIMAIALHRAMPILITTLSLTIMVIFINAQQEILNQKTDWDIWMMTVKSFITTWLKRGLRQDWRNNAWVVGCCLFVRYAFNNEVNRWTVLALFLLFIKMLQSISVNTFMTWLHWSIKQQHNHFYKTEVYSRFSLTKERVKLRKRLNLQIKNTWK